MFCAPIGTRLLCGWAFGEPTAPTDAATAVALVAAMWSSTRRTRTRVRSCWRCSCAM